jgi:hypothetical protein
MRSIISSGMEAWTYEQVIAAAKIAREEAE